MITERERVQFLGKFVCGLVVALAGVVCLTISYPNPLFKLISNIQIFVERHVFMGIHCTTDSPVSFK